MIRERNNLTVFKFDTETGSWNSFYVKNALIHYCRGIHEGLRGVKFEGRSIIRVKLKNPQDIYCGDKIAIGHISGNPPDNAMTVTSVTDNSKGTSYVRHCKIICEG